MPSAKRVRNRKKKEESSAEVIASNGDLLTELLLRLPVESLLRFRSVSKHWLSLISDSHFIRRKSLKPNVVSSLFFCPGFMEDCQLIPLDGSKRRGALKYLNFAAWPPAMHIVQSCNGLLLCGKYFVCNPSTKHFKALPPFQPGETVFAVSLAFDPSISQSYKVVCIHGCRESHNGCQILTYSSETGCWRVSGDPFSAPLSLQRGIFGATYWNGAIHWLTRDSSTLLYFDVTKEFLREMATPPRPHNRYDPHLPYFGESGGHLHLVYFNKDYFTTKFIVHEMERDRSGWFVKFVVNCNCLALYDPRHYLIAWHNYPPYNVLHVDRGEKEEDSYLVLFSSVKKEVIRYNLGRQTGEKIDGIRPLSFLQCDGWRTAFQYIESLSLL